MNRYLNNKPRSKYILHLPIENEYKSIKIIFDCFLIQIKIMITLVVFSNVSIFMSGCILMLEKYSNFLKF